MVVALVMVFLMGRAVKVSSAALILAAFAGAMLSMGFVLLMSRRVNNTSMLVVSGVMIGYICSAITELVVTFANDADIVQFNHYNFTNNQMQLCDNCRIEGIIDLSKVEVRKLFLSAEIMTLGCWNKLYRRSMVAESGAQYAEHRIYEEPAFVYPQMFCARRVYTMREAYYKIRMHTASTLHSEAKKAERLLDYSEVQMQLMKYLLTQRDFMVTYREKIELYFLRSYYIEQLYLAGKAKQVLDLTYFNKMQNTVKELFPEWRANSYLQDKNMQGLVSILETFETELDQEELSALCVRVAQM